MTAQVVLGTMPHPFPSAFSSPVATPTKELQFPSLPPFRIRRPHPRQPNQAATPSTVKHNHRPPVMPLPTRPFPVSQPAVAESSAPRTYRGPDARRSSRPRLRSLQSLNSAPHLLRSPNKTAVVLSSPPSRFHTSHPSLGRAPSRNASSRSSPSPSRAWLPTPPPQTPFRTLAHLRLASMASVKSHGHRRFATARAALFPPAQSRLGLSEFGQNGRSLLCPRFPTKASCDAVHTITTGISSAAQKRADDSSSHRSPPPNAMTYGPSSGRQAPKLNQRRQTVSNVSPTSLDRAAPAQQIAGVSPVPSRTLSYAHSTRPMPTAPAPSRSLRLQAVSANVAPCPTTSSKPRSSSSARRASARPRSSIATLRASSASPLHLPPSAPAS